MRDLERTHFVGGAASITCESELERLVKYLMAGDRSTEKDLRVMGGILFCVCCQE